MNTGIGTPGALDTHGGAFYASNNLFKSSLDRL
jgi:hypothetical protein